VEVEVMQALALDRDTIISGHFASGTRCLEGELADGTTLLIFDVPLPGCHSIPVIYFDLHVPYYSNYNKKSAQLAFSGIVGGHCPPPYVLPGCL